MAIITSTEDLQDIRQLVSGALTTATLPDIIIQRDIFLGLAERTILKRAGITEVGFMSLSEEEKSKILVAIKYYAATLIIPTIRTLVSESVLGIINRYEITSLDNKLKGYIAIINDQLPEDTAIVTGLSFVSKIKA